MNNNKQKLEYNKKLKITKSYYQRLQYKIDNHKTITIISEKSKDCK